MKYHKKILKQINIGEMYGLFYEWFNDSNFSHHRNGLVDLNEKESIKYLWKQFYEYLIDTDVIIK